MALVAKVEEEIIFKIRTKIWGIREFSSYKIALKLKNIQQLWYDQIKKSKDQARHMSQASPGDAHLWDGVIASYTHCKWKTLSIENAVDILTIRSTIA